MKALASSVVGVALLAGCANDRGVSGDSAGAQLVRKNTCASCHGNGLKGGSAPRLDNLAGSEVPLTDGSTVIADRAYLTESLVDPGAKRREGTTWAMPKVPLTDDEVAAIVDYLEDLNR